MVIEKVSAILQIGTKVKDFFKALIRVRELENENKQLRRKVDELTHLIEGKDQRIKELETTTAKQSQHITKLEEIMKQPYRCGLSCPICGLPLETEIPYQRAVGAHPKNGAPSMRTSRGTLEKEVRCRQCRSLVHIDFL